MFTFIDIKAAEKLTNHNIKTPSAAAGSVTRGELPPQEADAMTKKPIKNKNPGRDPPRKTENQIKKDYKHVKSGPRAAPPRPRQTNPKTNKTQHRTGPESVL